MIHSIVLGVLRKTDHPKIFRLRINPGVELEIHAETKEVKLISRRGGPIEYAQGILAIIKTFGSNIFDQSLIQQALAHIRLGREPHTFELNTKRLDEDYQAYVSSLGENLESQGRARRDLEAA